jgi:predicted RNA-binding protein YlqC (UPF0109 family)
MEATEEMSDFDSVLDEADLLLELVRSIVRKPEAVQVTAARGHETTILTIIVDPDDRGHVVGKDQQTIDAITHLFTKAAILSQRRIVIELVGHIRPMRGNRPGDRPDRRTPTKNPIREFKRSGVQRRVP